MNRDRGLDKEHPLYLTAPRPGELWVIEGIRATPEDPPVPWLFVALVAIVALLMLLV